MDCTTQHLADVDPRSVPRGTTRTCGCGAECVAIAAPAPGEVKREQWSGRVWFPTREVTV